MPLALERSGVESMPPTRPTSLFLEEASEMLIHEELEQNNNETKTSRKKKKRRATDNRQKTFNELYVPTGENLGEGAFGSVLTYRHLISGKEYAVKIIDKSRGRSRQKVLKEVEIFHHCKGHENILQLHEYFEEDDRFYLIFEKMEGGSNGRPSVEMLLISIVHSCTCLSAYKAEMLRRRLFLLLGVSYTVLSASGMINRPLLQTRTQFSSFR